jgi:hypothetical protein
MITVVHICLLIDDKVFKGYPNGNQPTDVQSVICEIKDISPFKLKGSNNPDINCGLSAVPLCSGRCQPQ